MLYKLIICVFVSSLIACKNTSNESERIERYESGAVSRTVRMVNGKKQGLMKDFYPDGNLMAERWFDDGMQSGRSVIYYPSGKVKEVQYYQLGQQTAGDTLWYENGQIQFAVTFSENKKNGYLRKWDTVGGLIFESKYQMDTLMEVNGRPLHQDTMLENSTNTRFIKPSKQF